MRALSLLESDFNATIFVMRNADTVTNDSKFLNVLRSIHQRFGSPSWAKMELPCGIYHRRLAAIFNGKSDPSLEEFRKICGFFGMEPSSVLSAVENPVSELRLEITIPVDHLWERAS